MPLIGHANVEIRAVDKFFERDVRKIVGNLKDVTVKLRADVDMKPVYNKLRTLRKSPHITKPIILTADVNPEAVYREMDKVWDDFDGRAFTVLVDADGLDEVHDKVTEIRDSLEGTHMSLTAEADTARAETSLALLARARTAHVKVNLDPQTVAAFKGAFHTITGTLPVAAVKSFFTGVTAHFEAIAAKSAALATVIGGAGAALLKFGGDAFVIADDLTQLIGIAAAGPAVIGTFAASITALTLGWKGFSKAFEDGEAFAALPKQARDTVTAMKGMGAAIQKATQVSYWNAVGDSVESFMRTVRGPLTKGLQGSGEAMGTQTKAMAGVLEAFTKSGQLTTTFDNINKGMMNATGAVSGFTKGFLELMEGGSKSMPAFGTWMSKIGTQFSNWAENANKTGKITEWIDQAVVRLKQLGSIAKSTVGIFDSIADAARAAGLDGLAELTAGMEKLDAAMSTPAFQKGLVSIFESADKAMSNIAPGLGEFFSQIGGHTEELGGLMETAGTIIGQFFDNIGNLLSRDKFWSGLQDLMTGTSNAMTKLEPGFGRLGDALGNTFSIMGTVVENIAPGLNLLFDTIAQITDVMGPGIKAVIPVFNEFVQALMTIAKSVVVPIAAAIGKIMEGFAALPGPVQTAILALAAIPAVALLAAKGLASVATVAALVGKNMGIVRGVFTGVGGAIGKAATAFGGISTAAMLMQKDTDLAAKQAAGGFTAIGSSAEKAADKTKGSVDKAAKTVSGGKGGFFGKIFGGAALGAMGGLPGILVGAGVATVFAVGTGIASSIAEQKAKLKDMADKSTSDIKSYTEIFDKVTGSIGQDSSGTAAKNLAETMFDIEGTQKSFSDIADSAGQSTDTIAKKLTSGLPAFKEYGSTWNDVRAKMEGTSDVTESMRNRVIDLQAASANLKFSDPAQSELLEKQAQNLYTLDKAWNDASGSQAGAGKYFRELHQMSDDQVRKLGMMPAEFDNMTKDQITSMSRGISGQWDAITAAGKQSAQEVQKAYADANLLAVSENQKVLNSSTSTAEQKLAAFQSNLAATGRSAIAQVEQQAYQTQIAVTAVKDGMKSMNTTLAEQGWNKDNAKGMLNTSKTVKGVLDYTKKGSQEVFQTMSTQAGTIQSAFVSAYDVAIKQNGNMETSLKTAMTSIQPMMDSVKAGLEKNFDPAQVKKIMESFNLDEESFEIGITAESSQAIAESLKVQKALNVLESGEYKALIKADSRNAASELEGVIKLSENYDNQEFEAALRVEASNAGMEFESFIAQFQNAPDQKDFLVRVREQGIAATIGKMEEINGKLSEADGKTVTAYLTADAEQGELDEFLTTYNSVDENGKKAMVNAVIAGENLDPFIAKYNSLDGEGKTALVKALLQGDGDVQNTLDGFKDPVTTPVTPKVEGDANTLVSQSIGTGVEMPVTPKMPVWNTLMSGISLEQTVTLKYGPWPSIDIPDISATVNVTANPAEVNAVKASMDAVNNKGVSLVVSANPDAVNTIKTAISQINNKAVSVTASADPGKVNSVKTAIAAVKSKAVSVTASADPGKVNSVKTAIAAVKSKAVSVTAKASPTQVNSVKTAIAAIKSKAVSITVSASATQVNAMKTAIAAVKAKSVKITATAPPQAVNTLAAAIAKVKGKNVSVIASAPAGGVNALRAAIAGVRSKTVRVTVITSNQNANGGMYMDNVRTFAKGGLDKVSKAIERKQRIGGGENRVAQIAKGSQNYRVWAESETGGEAYIPLSKAKRARSLSILQKVMDHFGVQAAQTFSSGGVLAGKAMGNGITSFASGGISSSTAERNAAKRAAADAKRIIAANKKVAAAKKKVDREQAQYNAINNKKVNAARKKSAKAELDAAKKTLATAKKTQESAKKAQTSSKESLKKQQEITKNARKDKGAILWNFKNDNDKMFGRQKSPLQENVDSMRKEAQTFINTYKKTRPKEAKAMEKVSKRLAAQGTVSKGYTREVAKFGGTKASARLAERAQKAQRTRSTKDNVLKGVTLRDYELSISRTGIALDKAEAKLSELESDKKRVVDSIATAMSGEFDLKSFAGGQNKFGFKTPMTAKGLSAFASEKLAKISGFRGKIKQLIAKGWDPALINEIVGMGVDDGMALATELAKQPKMSKEIKAINKTYNDIQWQSKDLGKLVGNNMYNAGIDSAQGLVDGLLADEKALKEAAAHLGNILYQEFKKAMGIKSPSRVMAKLGAFIPQGVALGIDSEQDTVKKSIQNLVRPADLTLNGNKTANGLPSLAKPSSSNGIIGGVVPEIHVHPSPGMNEVLVGQAAAREMVYRLQ